MISVKKSLKNNFFILAFALTGQIHTAKAEQKVAQSATQSATQRAAQKTVTIGGWIDTVTRNLMNDNKGNAHPLQVTHALIGNLSVDLDQATNKLFNTSKAKMIDEKRAAFNTATHLLAQDSAEQASQFNQLTNPTDIADFVARSHIITFDSVLKDIPLISIDDKIRAMIASGYLNNIGKDISISEAINDMVSKQKYSQTVLSYPNDLDAIERAIENLTIEKSTEDCSFTDLLVQGKSATNAKVGDLVWQAVYLKVFDSLAANYHLRQREKPWRVNAITDLLIHSLDNKASDNDKIEFILGTLQSAKILDTNNRLYSDEDIINAIISTDIDMNQLSNSVNGAELLSRLDPVSQLNFLRTEDSSKSVSDQIKAMLEKLHEIRPGIYENDLNYAMQQIYHSYTISPSLNTITEIVKGFLADNNEEFFDKEIKSGKIKPEDKLTAIATALKTIGSALPADEAIDALFLSQYTGKEAPNPTLTGNETQAEIEQEKAENMKVIDLNLVQQAGDNALKALQAATLNNIRSYDNNIIQQWFANTTNNTTSLMSLRDNFYLINAAGINGNNLTLVRK